MKRHRRTIVLGILIFLALVAGIALVLRRPSSAKELAAYKSELRAKGEKLSAKELTAGHSTNGLETLNELIAIAIRLPGFSTAPIPMTLRQGVDTGKARVGWVQPLVPLAGSRGTATWETVTAQLDVTEPLLLQLRSALQQPGLDAAWDPADLRTTPPPSSAALTAKRVAAQWLPSAMMIEMHRGRLNEASDDLHSLAMLARVDRDNPALREQMICIAIGRLSASGTWELLQTNAWTDAQLARMQTDLEQLNFAAAMEKGIVGVRAAFSDDMASAPMSVLNTVTRSGRPPREAFIDKLKNSAALGLWDPADDQLFYLQNLQITLESLRSVVARQPRNATIDKFHQTTAGLNGMSEWMKYRYPTSLILLASFSRAVETSLRAETERELTITAIALKRFQLRHTRPAPDLAALVPEFLPSIPYDPMSGSPLAYRLNADGNFVLYSVGDDGKDDGGDSAVAHPEAPRDLWRGRDAVWPTPVW